jgi:hypothetical protein
VVLVLCGWRTEKKSSESEAWSIFQAVWAQEHAQSGNSGQLWFNTGLKRESCLGLASLTA